MTEDIIELSIEEKMEKAYRLACNIAYSELSHDGTYFTVREDKAAQGDRIWCWVEGLVQKYVFDLMEGRCSLQSTIDFDLGEFEEQTDKDIEFFEGLLEKFGMPKRLTKQEMRNRGYVVK